MFSDQYQLIDFGEGRKLESYGPYVLDRPCPSAKSQCAETRAVWQGCSARFTRSGPQKGRWQLNAELPSAWTIPHDSMAFELRLTDSGHLGVFVEQAANWGWISRIIRRRKPCRVLNLFAYTGGATLAAAAAGAEVVHVDASRSAVSWARKNAKHSGLTDARIRWIADDAVKFVQREARRGSRYDAIILDPPSYGHGPQGETWKLSRHLMPLLQACRGLLSEHPALLLLTCHTPGYGPPEISAALTETIFGQCSAGVRAKWLSVTAKDGRRLRCGSAARWPES